MPKPPIILGVLVVGVFIAGVLYFSHGAGDESAASMQAASKDSAGGTGPAPSATTTGASAAPAGSSSQSGASASSVAPPHSDPRLDALKVSPDNGLIEFVRAPDGKVISEIDKDPASPSFHKPLREYLYAGDKVVGLTSYRYVSDNVEISRTVVSYKPDGSVDRFVESMQLHSQPAGARVR